MTARTSPFHGGNRGSNPRRDAIFEMVTFHKKPKHDDLGFFVFDACNLFYNSFLSYYTLFFSLKTHLSTLLVIVMNAKAQKKWTPIL